MDRRTPAVVSDLGARVAKLSVRSENACAIDTGGAAWCWGDNRYRQIGDGSATSERSAPVRVPGVPPVAAIATGSCTCAITAGGGAPRRAATGAARPVRAMR